MTTPGAERTVGPVANLFLAGGVVAVMTFQTVRFVRLWRLADR